MCGIAGWVSFDPDAPVKPDIAQAMTATVVCRGPDAEGLWATPTVALGHRRLSVVDPAGGSQPMFFERDGEVVVGLSYSGEVFNYRELRRELLGRGHTFRTASDTEVVLRAYLEWGEGCTERLNGMYAFALWDARSEELLLIRDRMGIKPLYYQPLPDGLLFGSEPKAILAHPRVRPAMDAEGFAELLGFTKTPGHALYKGMYELRPGHTLRIGRGGLSVRRYWAVESHEHTDDLDTTIGRVRELLEDIVDRQLVADVPVGTLLSGGLDSSVITALAARGRTAPIKSFALDFARHADTFQADDWRGTPDAPFAQLLARHVGSDHHVVCLPSESLLDTTAREAVMRARDLPFDLGDGDTSLYLMFKEVRRHCTVALSGESADEVFGGYRWFNHPETVAADTFPWLAPPFGTGIAGPGSGPGESLINRGLLTKIDLAGYRAQRYHEALAEVPRLPGESGSERRMREIGYLHLTRFLPWMLDRKDRASMAASLEVRVPFCDHRLVEYVFNTPWAMKSFDGREKSLLRAATRDLLPAEISDRVKAPYPTTRDPRYLDGLRAALRRVTDGTDSPVRELLDEEALAAATAEDPRPGYRTGTELVLALDFWLRRHDVDLEL
ncbi:MULTISPECIES: asparagine synthase (glutamine-hydrolyzing) [unclassified Streptomyces]|uniref:asparagine synthase (glutamine-hydrolyzing) n=1 Tax=unclassified Streptomyces TaxID=2593676 RepID=UPI0022B6DA8B|nr:MULTISPECIES: asparagine synthase (glutamine-hydrolyzing) [unclassified Streptomyces]MCZ7417488.1 asparagine synthase (glutamine-hydrolyzing) [Streptomyces sp. WMMC897]MCZ7432683.1 asparagine synthase (glutamine-hydrolyzing) [Streptomyces sp. WMMC1477]